MIDEALCTNPSLSHETMANVDAVALFLTYPMFAKVLHHSLDDSSAFFPQYLAIASLHIGRIN